MPDAPVERVSYGGDPNQFFELWQPRTAPVGIAVMIHGGFWRAKYDLSHANPFCAALAAKGVATASLEYRRVGQSGGGWPGTFEDVVAGVRAASKHMKGDPVVIGHSAGGHLALRLASAPVALRAVVALAPVADLRLAYELNLSNGAVAEFVGTSPQTNPKRYDEASPSEHQCSIPRVLVHGIRDEDVPIAISRKFIEALGNHQVAPTLIEIPDAMHMDLIDPGSPPGCKVIEIVLRMMEPSRK